MAVFTNSLGLLYAEVDSAESLRLAGDRVLYGAMKTSQAETEWLTRQKVGQCLDSIANIVQSLGGIVAATAGDEVFCNLPNADAAIEAACAIQRAQASATKDLQANSEGPPSAQLGIRIALHFGPILVDAGHLAGDALSATRVLLKKVDSDQIIATGPFIGALSDHHDDGQAAAPTFGEATFDSDLPDIALHEVEWEEKGQTLPAVPSKYDLDGAAGRVGDEPVGTGATPTTTEVAGTGAANPESEGSAPREGPELTLRFKGKKLILNRDQPMLMLRSGKERREHAKIRLDDTGFVLENLNTSGTRLRRHDGQEELCLEQATLDARGAISLGGDFSQTSQVIQFVATTKP